MNTRLKKWIRWLKVAHDDIQQLVINRNIFWEVQRMIKVNNELHKPSSFYMYLGDMYVAYVTIGIRRQIKVSRQSISFARLLTELADTPSILSREYYTSLYRGSTIEHLADKGFDKFSGSNRSYISPVMVSSDLERLNRAAFKVEEFADKRIAHHDRRNPNMLITFGEVDDCLDALDKMYVKYHQIFNGSSMDTLMPPHLYDWKEIFAVPWLKH
jgi:hypothetical protein